MRDARHPVARAVYYSDCGASCRTAVEGHHAWEAAHGYRRRARFGQGVYPGGPWSPVRPRGSPRIRFRIFSCASTHTSGDPRTRGTYRIGADPTAPPTRATVTVSPRRAAGAGQHPHLHRAASVRRRAAPDNVARGPRGAPRHLPVHAVRERATPPWRRPCPRPRPRPHPRPRPRPRPRRARSAARTCPPRGRSPPPRGRGR